MNFEVSRSNISKRHTYPWFCFMKNDVTKMMPDWWHYCLETSTCHPNSKNRRPHHVVTNFTISQFHIWNTLFCISRLILKMRLKFETNDETFLLNNVVFKIICFYNIDFVGIKDARVIILVLSFGMLFQNGISSCRSSRVTFPKFYLHKILEDLWILN